MEKVLDNHLAYERIDTWIRSMYHKYPSTFESPFSYPWWTTCEVLAAKELFSETTDPDSFLADVQKSQAGISKHPTASPVYRFALLEYGDFTMEGINKCMSAVMVKWGSAFKIRSDYSPDPSFAIRLTLILFAPVEGKKPACSFHDANLIHLELEEFIHASGVFQSDQTKVRSSNQSFGSDRGNPVPR